MMPDATDATLSPAEARDLHRIAGMMIPASPEHDVPGADDPVIFADILGSVGRDAAELRAALAALAERGGGALAALDAARAEAVAGAFLGSRTAAVATLGRVILQCYYRDDRVLRALGIDPRPPFPTGHVLEQGDWSLLAPVRARPPLWRDDRRR